MTQDARTIRFYDTAAEQYAATFRNTAASKDLKSFMALLPAGAAVLDLGCGPAQASVHLRAAGFRPDPVDAAQGMVDFANLTHAIGARVLTFDAIDMVAKYDGVWANFSLLHAPAADLPRHLRAIITALRPSGVLHIAMKTGTGARRDGLDRLYTFVTVAELQAMLEDAGFGILHTREGHDIGMAGTNDPFVSIKARKND